MKLSSRFDDLRQRAADADASVHAAASESRDQLKARIDEAQVNLDLAKMNVKQRTGKASDEARGKWAQIRADAAAKADDVKAKIEKRSDQIDAKAAEADAVWAERDAEDALDYAIWTVDNARLAALDALDARVYADELARAAAAR